MKNYFLFVLILLILVSVDHPSIAKPRQELFDKIMGVLSDSSKVKTDQEARRSLERIKEKLLSWNFIFTLMKFLYPEFLWALTVLAIPILIHLFNFKRYKTLYFSSLNFIKHV